MANETSTMSATVANWDNDPVLTVDHLTMRFGGLVAVNDLSFNVGRGDITALADSSPASREVFLFAAELLRVSEC